MTKKEPKIKIFVSHHKPWYIYEDDVFVPIQVWKKNAKVDLWILWDDTWDNISDKNSNYAELTAQYWVRKNYDLSNIGFCHYRRYLDFWYSLSLWQIIKILLKDRWLYQRCYELFDYIFAYRRTILFDKNIIKKYWENTLKYIRKRPNANIIWGKYTFGLRKNNRPLMNLWLNNYELFNILNKVILDNDPTYNLALKEIQNSSNVNYCNMFIMDKITFCKYSQRLFKILSEYENILKKKNLIKLSLDEHITAWTRFLWCLGERLLNLFVLHEKLNHKNILNAATKVFIE